MSCTVKSHPRIPEQDATEAIFLCSLHHDISMHAPLTGCDIVPIIEVVFGYIDFNPRTPYGMRP